MVKQNIYVTYRCFIQRLRFLKVIQWREGWVLRVFTLAVLYLFNNSLMHIGFNSINMVVLLAICIVSNPLIVIYSIFRWLSIVILGAYLLYVWMCMKVNSKLFNRSFQCIVQDLAIHTSSALGPKIRKQTSYACSNTGQYSSFDFFCFTPMGSCYLKSYLQIRATLIYI